MAPGSLTVAGDFGEVPLALLPEPLARVEQMLGVEADLDALGEFDFVLGGEQGGFADAVQIHAHEVGGGALGVQIAVVIGAGDLRAERGGDLCHGGLLTGFRCCSFNVGPHGRVPARGLGHSR